jgi:membrane protease YdiL (CAAX protease family)
MATQIEDHKSVWLFFVITYAFSWLFWIPSALAAHGTALPAPAVEFLNSPFNPAAFGPLFAAFLLSLLREGWTGVWHLLKRGLTLRARRVWLLPILILPFIIFAGGVLISALTGQRQLDLSVASNPIYAVIAFFVILLTSGPLQEEFGWRGYALPRLQSRFNALVSSLIVGFFWWLWHLPAVFIPGRFMTNDLLVFAALLVEIALTSILFTWIYNNTRGSVLATMLFHASMNWSIWLFMPDMQVTLSVIGFTTALLAVAVVVVILIWGAGRLSRTPEGV